MDEPYYSRTEVTSDTGLLTMEEIMSWLKVKDKRTILKYVEQGLPAIKLGYKSYRFLKTDVQEFLNQRKFKG